VLGYGAEDAAVVGSDGCFSLGRSGSRFVCKMTGMLLRREAWSSRRICGALILDFL
jgi:hypothetical protein